MTDKNRTRGRWQRVVILCGAAVLALAGCVAGDGVTPPPNSATQQSAGSDGSTTAPEPEPGAEPATGSELEPEDGGLTAEQIAATVEPHGFECTIEDARLSGRDQVVQCRGDNYVFITATSLVDPSTIEDELGSAKRTICKNQDTLKIDAMRTAVSGRWIMTPGGDDKPNLEAFNAVIPEFGIEMTTDPC